MWDAEEVIGETSDRENRRVVLLARVWRDKVLQEHPEMAHHLGDVLDAVAEPDLVVCDPRPERRRFHLRDAGPSRWIRVVVSYEQRPARIVTAFPNRKDPKRWTT